MTGLAVCTLDSETGRADPLPRAIKRVWCNLLARGKCDYGQDVLNLSGCRSW